MAMIVETAKWSQSTAGVAVRLQVCRPVDVWVHTSSWNSRDWTDQCLHFFMFICGDNGKLKLLLRLTWVYFFAWWLIMSWKPTSLPMDQTPSKTLSAWYLACNQGTINKALTGVFFILLYVTSLYNYLRIYLEQIGVDRYVVALIKRSKQMFLFSTILSRFPPLLLSDYDNVQMQKHRHLLRFKGPAVRKMNTNVAWPYLSVWH